MMSTGGDKRIHFPTLLSGDNLSPASGEARIREARRLAPSAVNTQPRRFILCGKDE
jgi:hypothetical protein